MKNRTIVFDDDNILIIFVCVTYNHVYLYGQKSLHKNLRTSTSMSIGDFYDILLYAG